MAHWPRYDSGDWDAICDSCGRKYKASELKKRWDGLMVCWQDYEVRQPQDFVKAQIDKQAVPWSRPEATDQFTTSGLGYQWIAGFAIAGTMTGGTQLTIQPVPPSTFTP